MDALLPHGWIQQLKIEFYTKQYMSASGWALLPDQIVSYGLYNEEVIRLADLVVTSAGNVFISW